MCTGQGRAAHNYPELMVLAIDHRSQFEDAANFGAADKERIASFKTLALRAMHAVARQDRVSACCSMDATDSKP